MVRLSKCGLVAVWVVIAFSACKSSKKNASARDSSYHDEHVSEVSGVTKFYLWPNQISDEIIYDGARVVVGSGLEIYPVLEFGISDGKIQGYIEYDPPDNKHSEDLGVFSQAGPSPASVPSPRTLYLLVNGSEALSIPNIELSPFPAGVLGDYELSQPFN